MVTLALAFALGSPDFQLLEAKMSGHFIAVEVHTSNGKPHMFLLDSGSNESYVSNEIASDSERKHDEAVVRLDIGGAQVIANAEPVDPKKIPVAIPGLPTEGVIGMNLLRQVQLDIDYSAKTVKARFGDALSWAGAGFTPVLMSKDPDSLFTIPAQIGDRHLRLCVDTGATAMVLDSRRVDLKDYDKLPSTKLHTFNGQAETNRFLIDSMKLGEQVAPWMIAYSHPWPTSDDGTIGTAQLGSSRVVLDFPGACIYLERPDQMSEAAERILGIPVRVDASGLRFKDNLPSGFKSASGAKIVAVRWLKSDIFLSALQGKSPDSRKTLVEAFKAMRELGLVTTEHDGQKELVPMQVRD